MLANFHGYHSDLADLRRRFSISLKGATLAQLARHASAMQLSTRPLRLNLDELAQLNLPCILHWRLNHFVVLTRVRKNRRGEIVLVILDPAVGERKVSLAETSDEFTGVALEVTPSPAFRRSEARKKISVKDLAGKVVGLPAALMQVLLLALALEIFAVASPLFGQFIIDEVIVSGDRGLLVVIVLGFALLVAIQTAVGLARSWFLMRWSMDISFQWSGRVFGHLIRLPTSFFEKRHLADVVSRFSSIGVIQNTLTSLFVECLLDGLMAIVALAMMLLYSSKLTAAVVAGVSLYAILRWVFYQPFREAAQARIILAAREGSHFLETLRSITAIKLFGHEDERRIRWQNLIADLQNRDIRTQKLAVAFKAAHTTIFALQGLAIFYFGAGLVMDNALSVGMLMAFTSYSGNFAGRIFNLIDLFINVKMLDLHCERLADIVLEETEENRPTQTDTSRLRPQIEVKNLKFRYADGEPWILNGLDLTIPAGQNIAVVGASGCGKTTLCKVILGLLRPTEGEVLIDGVPINQIGLSAYRQLVGAVMQDDGLLAGSIKDNVSFFESGADAKRVEQCAMQAAIHEEIVRMPMGYQSLVGDMGSSLSGGQKQRLLLARSLYKKPKILVLDEATSHLDIGNEGRVNLALKGLSLTRIVIAHRPETISVADRVVELRDGRAIEVRASRIRSRSEAQQS